MLISRNFCSKLRNNAHSLQWIYLTTSFNSLKKSWQHWLLLPTNMLYYAALDRPHSQCGCAINWFSKVPRELEKAYSNTQLFSLHFFNLNFSCTFDNLCSIFVKINQCTSILCAELNSVINFGCVKTSTIGSIWYFMIDFEANVK